MANGMIRAARVHSSSRLQRLLEALSDGKWHSTMDLTQTCNNYAVGTSISELRANGIAVTSRRQSRDGARWFEYRLGRDIHAPA